MINRKSLRTKAGNHISKMFAHLEIGRFFYTFNYLNFGAILTMNVWSEGDLILFSFLTVQIGYQVHIFVPESKQTDFH